MTLPTGFVLAERVAGVVKLPDRVIADGTSIAGSIVGPGDTALIPADEAASSDFWKTDYTPASTSTSAPTNTVGSVPSPPTAGSVGTLVIQGGN